MTRDIADLMGPPDLVARAAQAHLQVWQAQIALDVVALGTGLGYAGVGLQHWPDAPPLLEEYAELRRLEKGVTGRLTALVVEEVTDDWQWPFND